MYVTEEEAKTKWCPRSRVITASRASREIATIEGSQPACNRIGIGPGSWSAPDASCCIGSGCMMWDWIDSELEIDRSNFRSDTAPVADEKGPWSWDDARRRWVRPNSARRGRCGLRSEIPDA